MAKKIDSVMNAIQKAKIYLNLCHCSSNPNFLIRKDQEVFNLEEVQIKFSELLQFCSLSLP